MSYRCCSALFGDMLNNQIGCSKGPRALTFNARLMRDSQTVLSS